MSSLKKYLLIGGVLLMILSCSKNTDKPKDSEGNNSSKQSLQIEEALFTNPLTIANKAKDNAILNRLIIYLNHTPKGATVYLHIYILTYQPIVNALIDAYNRGVKMKILIDYAHGRNDFNKGNIDYLKSLFQSPSVVKAMNNDVRANMRAIDHNKYMLFSEVDLPEGKVKNLVWASSHNLSEGAAGLLQDAVIMSNEGLYQAFKENWEVFAANADRGLKENFDYTANKIGDSITAFFFPRIVDGSWNGQNTIIEQLNKLSNYTEDTVCVLMSEFRGVLGEEIANKLVSLVDKGVNVQVIIRAETNAASEEVQSILEDGLAGTKGFLKRIDRNKTGTIHSKTMLINGFFEGEKQQVILTGSLNYHTTATSDNGNFLLMLKNSVLFKDYWENFMMVKKTF